MGVESVLWERNLFHGDGSRFMGVKSTEYQRHDAQMPRGSEAMVAFIERS